MNEMNDIYNIYNIYNISIAFNVDEMTIKNTLEIPYLQISFASIITFFFKFKVSIILKKINFC